MFKDQYRAVMQYSLPRDGRPGEPPRILHDWICTNVSTLTCIVSTICLFFVLKSDAVFSIFISVECKIFVGETNASNVAPPKVTLMPEKAQKKLVLIQPIVSFALLGLFA